MTLPDLVLQTAYGRLAWAVVMAAVILGWLPPALQRSWRAAAGLLCGLALLVLLPGQLSPAFWLAMAFHWPSGLLLGCCVLRLWQRLRPDRGLQAMPREFAAAVAGFGLVLYVDAMGLTSLGLYYWGFAPRGAPMMALAAAMLCGFAVMRGIMRPQAAAVLAALLLFSALRLPSGNLWDALLDPLLWGWAVVSLGVQAWRRRAQRPAPATAPEMEVDAALVARQGQ
ncbi:hypothetical protein [Massilia endophytica]|uniref:hypothetical protein n=1 Tax=Massilia endophytica TaxID=2899220 RepID=UPI001E414732|nr:hypothetical protein [Massilia endophytica]UGQ48755.1 hypothetical protein LSQ66_09925 [Massilia endophytica]